MSRSAADIARAVRCGKAKASDVAQRALAAIAAEDGRYGCFTRVFADRALADAAAIDRKVAAGEDPGPLAGVPFAVKDLFDVVGVPTTAGAKLRAATSAASADAACVRRLAAAGAVLVGACNMDEFAYGFVTVNAWSGTTRNPRDPARLAGGSSGGSAAAVAAGFVPLALGSDTNGSIRVPAALCGVWGLRPSGRRIEHGGMFPFAATLDQPGPLTATAEDLALALAALTGGSVIHPRDEPLRVGLLGGWFEDNADPAMADAAAALAHRIGADVRRVSLDGAALARSAAYVITAAEGGALHLAELRARAAEFDSATRDRLLAGALLPAAAYLKALDVASGFKRQVDALFTEVDLLVAPSTPITAPLVDQTIFHLRGRELPVRADLGLLTQPLSLADIPIVSAPARHPDGLPMGLQLAAARGREEWLLGVATRLERDGVVGLAML